MADERESQAQPMPLRQVGRALAPWAVGAGLGVVLILALFSASHAGDPATYDASLVAAGLALLALGWIVKAHFDSPAEGPPFSPLVDTIEALAILVPLLVILAIVGLVMASDWQQGTLHDAGFALCLVSIIIIGWNLKHYFDVQDRGGR